MGRCVGIPRGSVLGPLLFLIFINDLEDDIVSVKLKFADDTKIFRKVTNATDGLQLTTGFEQACDWADKWQMEFNIAVRPCTLVVAVPNMSII